MKTIYFFIETLAIWTLGAGVFLFWIGLVIYLGKMFFKLMEIVL